MRKFILQIIILFSIFSIIFIGINFLLISTRIKLLKFPSNINTVYLGNSMVESGVNDSCLSSSLNFARRTEPINYIYAKIKLLHELNPNIKTIVMGFDNVILYNNSLGYKGKNALYFLDQFSLNDWKANITKAPIGYSLNTFNNLYDFKFIKPMLDSYFNKADIHELDIGGYLCLNNAEVSKDIAKRQTETREIRSVHDFPDFNKYYINKIIEYCDNNNLELKFLKTPQHWTVREDTTYRKIHNQYYSDIELLDFLDKNLPDSCYSDCIHLNKNGAKVFTKVLSETINTPAN